jgi:hypothetical protein
VPVTIMLCRNNPDNGNPTPYADSVELFDCHLTGSRVRVACTTKPLPDATPVQGLFTLHVGRVRIPCLDYRTWVGNWCWDAASVRLIFAVQVWNYLAANPNWHCEEGPSKLFEMFNAHTRIDPRTAPDLLKEARI